jgi:hypothetical protein
VVPEDRVAVIELVTDCPWTTDLAPALESEKLKAGGGGVAFTVSENEVVLVKLPETPLTTTV